MARVRPLPLVFPPGLRFTCHGCGACCRGFTVALEPGERARILRHDWRREHPRFAGGFARPGTGPHGDARDELCKVEGGACIFLDEADGLCLVEKRLGRAAKPRTCRKFPVELVAAPDGLRAVVSVECESRWRSAGTGALLEASRAEVEALAAEGEPYRVAWRVQVAKGGRLLAPEEYLALERALQEAGEAPGSLEDVVHALGVVIARSAAPQGPSRALHEALAALAARARSVAQEHAPLVGCALDVLAAEPLAWRRALRHAESSPEGAAFLRLCLRSWVEAAIPGREQTAEEGVGRMILGLVLVATTARALAAEAETDPASPAGEVSPPSPALLNRAARVVSAFLRGRAAKPLREATGGFAAIARGAGSA